MSTILLCLTLMALMPYLAHMTTAVYRFKQKGHYDLATPRRQMATLTGIGERASHLQMNCWEALIFFAAAILATFLAGVPAELVGSVSIAIVTCRVLYFVAYLGNFVALRVTVFSAGLIACFYLYFLALTA